MSEDQKCGLSLSSQIAIGLAAGILFGIFFVELAGFVSVVADGYIKLLQMTVLPYVTFSLIGYWEPTPNPGNQRWSILRDVLHWVD